MAAASLSERLKKACPFPTQDHVIPKAEMMVILKGLDPSWTKDELDTLFNIADKNKNGEISYSEFVDFICFMDGDSDQKKKLCKPLKDEERKKIEAIAKKYDKDGNGHLDLKEIQSMITDLGHPCTEEEAMAAMKDLDKDGSKTCDLDEFILWWTSTPGMGGYSSLVLTFMKAGLDAKMKLQAKMKSMAKARKEAMKAAMTEEQSTFKYSVDIGPGNAPVDDRYPTKASLEFMPRKRADLPKKEDSMKLTFTIAAGQGKDCRPIVDQIETLRSSQLWKVCAEGFAEGIGADLPVKWWAEKRTGTSVGVNMEIPPEMAGFGPYGDLPDLEDEEQMKEWGQFMDSTFGKASGKIGLGANADSFLEDPQKNIVEALTGVRFDCQTTLSAAIYESMGAPKELTQFLKLYGAFDCNMRLGYDPAYLHEVSKTLEAMDPLSMDPLSKVLCTSFEKLEASFDLLEAVGSEVCPEDRRDTMVMLKCLNMLGECEGLASVELVNIPGLSYDFEVKCEDFNPFKVLASLILQRKWLRGLFKSEVDFDEVFPKLKEKAPKVDPLARKLPPAEQKKLKETFDKYDKDNSGYIDLKELYDMCKALGAKITEEQAKEAMVQLDTDKNGTCCFDEFVTFWTTDSGCGGHSNLALKVLKVKLAAEAKLAAGFQMMKMKAKGAMADFQGKTALQLLPGMVDFEQKMKITASFSKKECPALEAPKFHLKLSAKDAGEAKRITEVLKNHFIPGSDGRTKEESWIPWFFSSRNQVGHRRRRRGVCGHYH